MAISTGIDESKLPALGFHFRVTFTVADSDIDTRFSEVSGLTAELEFDTLAEAGENRFTRRLPSRTKFNNLVLKRGLSPGASSKLTTWVNAAIFDHDYSTSNITIELLNEKHVALKSWKVVNAYPVKAVISDFKAMESSIVIESLELAFEFFTPN
jgi:phage tail-like protein